MAWGPGSKGKAASQERVPDGGKSKVALKLWPEKKTTETGDPAPDGRGNRAWRKAIEGPRGYLGPRLQTTGGHQSSALKGPWQAWLVLSPSLSYPLKRQLPLHCASGEPSGKARPGVKWLLSSSCLSLPSNSLNNLL